MKNSAESIVRKLREARLLNERTDYKEKSRDELIDMAQSGDQMAFNTLVDQHQDLLNAMANKYFLNVGDRDDTMQIISLAFWDAVRGWGHRGDFEAYAGMLIKQRMTDEIRKENTEKSNFNRDADSLDRPIESEDGGDRETLADLTPNGEASPEDQYVDNAGVKVIMDFIENDLSDNERSALKMYIDGYKVSEIAEKTGIKYKSVENALRRSKEKLAEYLRDMNEGKLVEGSIFTDKEIAVLKDIFNRLGESLKESKSVEDMTQEEIEEALYDIEYKANEIAEKISYVEDMDEYYDLLSEAEELQKEISPYEEWIDDPELAKFYEDLWQRVHHLDDLPADNVKWPDWYDYNGVRESDF